MRRSLFKKYNGLRKQSVLSRRSLVCEPLEERTLLSVGPELQLLSASSGIETVWFQEVALTAQDDFQDGVSSLELIEDGEAGISGRLTVPGLNYETIATEVSDFTRLEVPGWSTTDEVGRPELPVFRTSLAIPANVDVVVTVTPLDSVSLSTMDPVYPTQPLTPDLIGWEETEEASIFWFDTDYYSGDADSDLSTLSTSDSCWSSELIIAGENHSIAIEFYPFQYDAVTGDVSVVTSFDFNIEFVEQPVTEVAAVTDTDLVSSAGGADYIIVTADAYYEEILPLAEWKQKMGYKTYVAKMSEIGSTEQDVYNFLKAAYDADSKRPEYVLLVGDHENVPACEIVGHPYYSDTYVWHTDYDYSLLEGTDNVADVAIGRLPGDTEAQITTMVNKILTYECTPDTSDRYDDILLAGFFQDEDDDGVHDMVADRFFMEDLHRIADFLGGDYDFWSDPDPYDKGFTIYTSRVWESSTSNTLYYRSSSYPGRITPPSPVPDAWKFKSDVSSISTTINNGVGIVLHRDHGSTSGWGDPSFYTSSVNNLHNGDMLPVVFSLNCLTGQFDGIDAFGEAWMRNANGGAVAMTGAARVSYSGPNDSLHVGIFDSMWSDYATSWQSSHFSNSWHFGEVMNYGKDRVFSGYGYSSSSALLAARLFNVFGDPEMQIRTETPVQLDATYTESVVQGESTHLTVTVTRNGSPVVGALVAITHGDEYWVGSTNGTGKYTFFNLTTADIGTYDVVVTERNSIPFQGVLESIQASGMDLYGTNFDVTPDNLLLAAGMATADFSILNLGDTAAGSFNVRFYMSDDATIDPATDVPLSLGASDPGYNPSDPEAYHISSLNAMMTYNAWVTLVVPTDDPFGTDNQYFIGMMVDADGDVGEIDENNNVNLGQDLDLDDVDYTLGPLDHFVWTLNPSTKHVDTPFPVSITAVDSNGLTVTDYDGTAELTGWVGGAGVIYSCDFESDNGGWVPSATWDPVGDWQWGVPTTGPGEAFSGQNVWATVLDGDYTDQTGVSYLTQTFDFTGRSGVELNWQQWAYTRYFTDYARVYVNGDLVYSRRSLFATSDYEQITVDLSAYDNLGSVTIAFALDTQASWNEAGWYIDDIVIRSDVTSVPITPTTTGNFVDGVWTGPLTVLAAAEDVCLHMDDGNGHTGVSDTFDVIDAITLPGDANHDGQVDGSDATILASNWQAGMPNGDPANVTWEMGDFNGDGKVDGSDATILAGNWQTSVDSTTATTSVQSEPESESEPVQLVIATPNTTARGMATVPRRESLLPRCTVTPIAIHSQTRVQYRTTDAALTELTTLNETDYTALAKDLASISKKKSITIGDKLLAFKIDPYADWE